MPRDKKKKASTTHFHKSSASTSTHLYPLYQPLPTLTKASAHSPLIPQRKTLVLRWKGKKKIVPFHVLHPFHYIVNPCTRLSLKIPNSLSSQTPFSAAMLHMRKIERKIVPVDPSLSLSLSLHKTIARFPRNVHARLTFYFYTTEKRLQSRELCTC
ncbi:hypothetical protein AUEXF2481DRAFT_422178 [Aureobasidium subglaciale EXF-2481]|uniref:Uncharacterized protein n=1 Tax=Aureobasidium subglaciale (strain EXF-2481) TaxID=1043005 RepID=A0A074Y415_AURSE|nr:uncharacterized protein AUEXF2481DRAFT_422178 [Aureobasidium subglaciale EXF-2481]KEQ92538.1 hypothetical protein AUEXF2481DRAFT_422178 [Aureobasidium subglaciale EXF-2481]